MQVPVCGITHRFFPGGGPQGAQVVLGGNDSYIAMCHKCYIRGIREHRVIRLHGHN